MDYKMANDFLKVKNDFIPFPVNVNKLEIPPKLILQEPIVIFHGINRVNYYKKGNDYFEAALEIIKAKVYALTKANTAL